MIFRNKYKSSIEARWTLLDVKEYWGKNNEKNITVQTCIYQYKSRLIDFKTILRSKKNYACTIIWNNNDKYTKRWDSMIYRLLRALFWIKVNVNKEKLFNILNVEYGERYINNLKEKQKYPRLHSILNTRKVDGGVSIIESNQAKIRLLILKKTSKTKMKLAWNYK